MESKTTTLHYTQIFREDLISRILPIRENKSSWKLILAKINPNKVITELWHNKGVLRAWISWETETSYVSVMTSLDVISDVRYIKGIHGDKHKLYGDNQDELMMGDGGRAPNEGWRATNE